MTSSLKSYRTHVSSTQRWMKARLRFEDDCMIFDIIQKIVSAQLWRPLKKYKNGTQFSCEFKLFYFYELKTRFKLVNCILEYTEYSFFRNPQMVTEF